MTHPRKIATAVVAAAVLAAPSAASAHSKPSVGSVREHVRSADQALTMVAKRVQHNNDAAAAVAAVRNLRQTKAAAREAARVTGRSKRAKAWRLVAAQRDDNVKTLIAVVDDVGGAAQVDMTTALVSNLTGRELAVAKLTALAATLPDAAQAGIATAIAAISGQTAGDVAGIAQAMNSGQISAAAKPHLEQALGIASGAMFTGVAQLQQIVGMLPPQAQGPVNAAIAKVTGILQAIFGTGAGTGGLLGNLPIPENLPIPCGLPIPSFVPISKPC